MRHNMRYANNLYSKGTFAIGRKSDTDFAALVFRSILKSVIRQEGGTFPLVGAWARSMARNIFQDERLHKYAESFVGLQRLDSCRWSFRIWNDNSFLFTVSTVWRRLLVPERWGWFECDSFYTRNTFPLSRR